MKKIFFFVLLAFPIESHCSAGEIIFDAVKKIINLADDIWHSKERKNIDEQRSIEQELALKKEIVQNTEQCAAGLHKIGDAQKENNEIFRDLKEKAETAFKVITVAGTTIYIMKSGYEFISFVQDSISPSPETKLRKRLVVKNLELLDAEDELNRCLVKNKKGEKEHNGLPRACEVLSDFYAAVAGQEALDKITYAFSKNNR
ncbi:hypothetical protein HYX58_00705 [Candidatus Dependentiae bacterium]|nr:hypothetical protein [Candidatus Dependentiae bacterium]